MIKLVSKNPVQRFKDGQKIQKFKNPNGRINWIRNENGNRYYTVDRFNVFENGEIWDTKTGKKVDENLTAYKNDLNTTNKLRKIISDNKNNKSSYIKGNYPKIGTSTWGTPIYRAPNGDAIYEDGDIAAKAGEDVIVYGRKRNGFGHIYIKPTVGMDYWNARSNKPIQQPTDTNTIKESTDIKKQKEKQKPNSTQRVGTGSTQRVGTGSTQRVGTGSTQRVGTGSKQPLRTGSKQTTAKNSPTITYQFSRPTMQDVQGTRTDLTNDLSDADNQVNQYQLHQRGRLGTGVGWNQGYQKMFSGMDDDDKALLSELGLPSLPQTASELQTAMQDYAKRAGIDINGITADNFVDNKWGQQSQSAWDTLKYIITRKDKDGKSMAYMTGQQDSVVPPSISQPYRSQYDYSRGTKGLRDLGIYDYNSMMNYVRSNSTAPFSTDLTNYLQDKYKVDNYDKLTQQQIEQALDVKGRYRRGRNGDLDDINRTLSTYWSTKTPEEPIVVNPQYSNILKNNLGEEFLNNTKKYYTTYFKKGGLISKNPVEQFKAGGIMKFQGGTNPVWTDFFNFEIPQEQLSFYMDPKFTGKGIEGSNTLEGSTSLPGITVVHKKVKKANVEPTKKQKSSSSQKVRTGSKQSLRTSSTTGKSTPTITYQFSHPTMQDVTNSIWTNGGFLNVDIPTEVPFYRTPIEGSNTLEGSTSLPGITVVHKKVPTKEQLRNQRIQQYKKDFKQDKTKAYINQFNTTEELQRDLNRKGFKLKVDGLYGPKTKQAVKDYLATIAFDPNSNVGTELKWQEQGIQDNFDRQKLPDFATDTHKDERFFDSEWITPKWFPTEQ